MSQCATTPTATQFTTITTTELSTTFSQSVSTLSPTVSTITTSSCTPAAAPSGSSTNSSTSEVCSTFETVSTIGGGVSTVQVPITVTVTTTSSSPTATLFTTSCGTGVNTDSDTGSNTPTSGTTSSSSTPTDTPTSLSTSASTIIFSSSFTSDGSVIFTTGTTVTQIVTAPPAQGTGSSSQDVPSSSSNVGPIVGGILGGVSGAIVLAVLGWIFFRKRRRNSDLDDILWPESKPAETSDFSRPSPTPPPKVPPYHYTALGTTPSVSEGPTSVYSQSSADHQSSLLARSTVPPQFASAPLAGPSGSYPNSVQTSMYSGMTHMNAAVPPGAVAAYGIAQAPGFGMPAQEPRRQLQVVNDEEMARARNTSPLAEKSNQTMLHPEFGLTAMRGQQAETSASGPAASSSRAHLQPLQIPPPQQSQQQPQQAVRPLVLPSEKQRQAERERDSTRSQEGGEAPPAYTAS